MKTYLVGGAVRDALLGLDGSDRDWVVVGASTEEMLALGYRPVGKDFPVFLHPDTHEEYALARTERKSGKGYKGFTVYAAPDVTLEQDLQRRDLTINAIAQDNDGQLIDPWQGQQDIQNRLLRHVSPAFREDPLRVLRAARFAARFAPLGFSIADETLALMRDICADGELQHLTAERVWREIETALGERRPRVFFEVLRDCGALAVLIPALERQLTASDAGDSLAILDQACAISHDKAVRFAALMHKSANTSAPGLITPKEYSELTRQCSEQLEQCQRALTLEPGELLALYSAVDVFRRPERLDKMLQVCEADARARDGLNCLADTRSEYPHVAYLRAGFVAIANISVPELLRKDPVPPGPQAGEIIRQRLHDTRLAALQEFIAQHRPVIP